MPSAIIFDPNATTTNTEDTTLPPTRFFNSELKKCFYNAAVIFNAHQEEYASKWNFSEDAIGSAYLNIVYVLYCKMRNIGLEGISSRDMHKGSRCLHSVAKNYYLVEMNVLNDKIRFERGDAFLSEFDWEYTPRGFQMLRNYNLLEYIAYSGMVSLNCLVEFCDNANISLRGTSPEAEIKILKLLQINDSKYEIPESIQPETLSASIKLIEEIARSGNFGFSITNIGCKDVIKVFRRGNECNISDLCNSELSRIAVQLEQSPNLMRKLISIGVGNGSI